MFSPVAVVRPDNIYLKMFSCSFPTPPVSLLSSHHNSLLDKLFHCTFFCSADMNGTCDTFSLVHLSLLFVSGWTAEADDALKALAKEHDKSVMDWSTWITMWREYGAMLLKRLCLTSSHYRLKRVARLSLLHLNLFPVCAAVLHWLGGGKSLLHRNRIPLLRQ